MLTCREVVTDTDRLIAGELTRRQRWAMHLHLIMCRHCRRYVRQMRALLRAIPTMHAKASEQEVAEVMDVIDKHSAPP